MVPTSACIGLASTQSLVDCVPGRGPIDDARMLQLEEVFDNDNVSLRYVTAFPDRVSMGRMAARLAWGTAAWIADEPYGRVSFGSVHTMYGFRQKGERPKAR